MFEVRKRLLQVADDLERTADELDRQAAKVRSSKRVP